MRILIVSQYFWPETFRINELSQMLVERGHDLTVLTGVPNYPSGEVFLPASASGWLVLLGLAWISHAAGQGLIAYALAHLPAGFSSVGLLFQPVMAALFAWVLLGESLVALQVAGGAVVLAGIYMARKASSQ